MGGTVVDYAAYHGRLEIFKNISSTLKDFNPWNKPLRRAAQGDQLDIVKVITSCLTDINPSYGYEETTLHFAAQKGSLSVVKWYLDNLKGNKNPSKNSRADYDTDIFGHLRPGGRTPLHDAAKNGHSSCCQGNYGST